MSQDEILKYVTENPGCLQMNLHINMPMNRGSVADQVRRLVRKGDIRRIPCPGHHQLTYKLYAVKEDSKNQDNRKFCNLRTQDTNFNKSKGANFIKAFDIALSRGDFK